MLMPVSYTHLDVYKRQELGCNPLGVFSNLQCEFFRAHRKARLLRSRIWSKLKIHAHFAGIFLHRIIRPRNVGPANTVLALDGYAHAAFAKLIVGDTGRTQAKRALAALQVGNAHPGKQYALELLWRKCDRNANHGTDVYKRQIW